MRKRFFGQYLLSKGLITAPQLLAAVEYQDKYNSRLGELAVALGMVTPFDAQRINALQVREDKLFGEAAVALGLLSDAQVADVLATQRDGHVLLGQALQTLGYLTPEALETSARDFLDEASRTPDGVSIPPDLKHREVAAVLFELAHKALLRAWDMPNKPDELRIESMRLTLSDRNARVALTGSVGLTVLIGVPNDAARKAASRYTSEADPSEEELDGCVQELARLLCDNLTGSLAERGYKTQVHAVSLQGARATLPPEVRVAMVPFLTHYGQVLVGLTL